MTQHRSISGWIRCGALLAVVSSAAFGQAPAITKGGIVNGAIYDKPVTAGNIVAIFGTNLATKVTSTDSVLLSTTLGNVSVTFNGINAALQFVAPGQINAQVPWNVMPAGTFGTVNAVVTSQGQASAPEPVTISAFGPGVYAANGHAFAIIATDPADTVHYGSFAAPVDTFGTGCSIVPQPSSCFYKAFPAKVNDVLLVYAGGLGALDNTPPTGGLPAAGVLAQTTTKPTVLVSNIPAKILYSGASSFVGVYQINMTVPQVAAGSALPFQIQVGGITTPATTTIAVQ